MHAFLILMGIWVFAFVTLALALIALNIYSDFIGYDFALNTLRQELILAAICSFVEAGSLWTVSTYVPAAGRALFIPFMLVTLIYTAAHLDVWNRFDGIIVLIFQFAIGGTLACLFSGHIGAAATILTAFVIGLAIIAGIARGL